MVERFTPELSCLPLNFGGHKSGCSFPGALLWLAYSVLWAGIDVDHGITWRVSRHGASSICLPSEHSRWVCREYWLGLAFCLVVQLSPKVTVRCWGPVPDDRSPSPSWLDRRVFGRICSVSGIEKGHFKFARPKPWRVWPWKKVDLWLPGKWRQNSIATRLYSVFRFQWSASKSLVEFRLLNVMEIGIETKYRLLCFGRLLEKPYFLCQTWVFTRGRNVTEIESCFGQVFELSGN